MKNTCYCKIIKKLKDIEKEMKDINSEDTSKISVLQGSIEEIKSDLATNSDADSELKDRVSQAESALLSNTEADTTLKTRFEEYLANTSEDAPIDNDDIDRLFGG